MDYELHAPKGCVVMEIQYTIKTSRPTISRTQDPRTQDNRPLFSPSSTFPLSPAESRIPIGHPPFKGFEATRASVSPAACSSSRGSSHPYVHFRGSEMAVPRRTWPPAALMAMSARSSSRMGGRTCRSSSSWCE